MYFLPHIPSNMLFSRSCIIGQNTFLQKLFKIIKHRLIISSNGMIVASYACYVRLKVRLLINLFCWRFSHFGGKTCFLPHIPSNMLLSRSCNSVVCDESDFFVLPLATFFVECFKEDVIALSFSSTTTCGKISPDICYVFSGHLFQAVIMKTLKQQGALAMIKIQTTLLLSFNPLV